jgi:D-beta-D-heptose 7-phosphate kinase/D-beta-D-heptose 1-phosphate adenosyltransferase
MKIVVVTGGFDPLHSGHIAYFKAARTLGDMLIVGINSDDWLVRKKGQAFMPWHERMCIVNNLSMVDKVYEFDDINGSACTLLEQIKHQYPYAEIIFANGGDRTATNIPEMVVKDVTFRFGIGGDSKQNSSSWILQDYKNQKTFRPWGYYRVLHDVEGCKVKELTIDPNQSLSMQRHKKRNEFWIVTEGQCDVHSMMPNGYYLPTKTLTKHQQIFIQTNDWHKLSNPHNEPCKIVEIQYGTECVEEDIERKNA